MQETSKVEIKLQVGIPKHFGRHTIWFKFPICPKFRVLTGWRKWDRYWVALHFLTCNATHVRVIKISSFHIDFQFRNSYFLRFAISPAETPAAAGISSVIRPSCEEMTPNIKVEVKIMSQRAKGKMKIPRDSHRPIARMRFDLWIYDKIWEMNWR